MSKKAVIYSHFQFSSLATPGESTRAEVSTLKNAKLCKIGVECVEFM